MDLNILRELARPTPSLRSGELASTPSLRQRNRVLEGLANREFTLAYQPVVDARGASAVGAEALLRWHHPVRGWLRPGAFIQTLEQDREIAWEATAFVVAQIAADLSASPGTRRNGFVSFNVYPSQLLGGKLRQLLESRYLARGHAPEALLIELLETEPQPLCDGLVEEIRRLRALGFRIAIDDFGCGSWSLLDLTRTEVDAVKLARELLQHVPAVGSATEIMLGALRILEGLGTQAIIEGVETPEQAAWVAAIPRAWAQGYAFARPQPGLPKL
ncbi:EAL domain-containing protein [Paraburkholderia sp. MMS20-SJTR3]|uniref:EAL domain-containing protein n=1 Tax=Paraburkholderia sejongensis TaxID=2886946 RepID=A0ABS8K5X9_9BURK|nr:EAL domain-containing protein [Paraburkholderia sp. MMS20-SJTR3]MCC8397535.1 EAL domain-containing protein [Paraburkholderia sp. MMS20-SJTR3]